MFLYPACYAMLSYAINAFIYSFIFMFGFCAKNKFFFFFFFPLGTMLLVSIFFRLTHSEDGALFVRGDILRISIV